MSSLDEVNVAIPVDEVMSSPVIMVSENDTVEVVAKLMGEYNLGSVVVVDEKSHPIGVITERDIVLRLVIKGLSAREVSAKSIMSSPLATIGPKTDLKKAADKMWRGNISRLIVMDNGEMIGIISDTDIVAITPSLIEIITEKVRITGGRKPLTDFSTTGYCEQCLQWSTSLKNMDAKFICEECRINLGGEV